uniref:Putative secreted protein n=1 Tax=Xenopsylla cheopis TaxID=163159 RepID=A0A6M2DY48_XENCH
MMLLKYLKCSIFLPIARLLSSTSSAFDFFSISSSFTMISASLSMFISISYFLPISMILFSIDWTRPQDHL